MAANFGARFAQGVAAIPDMILNSVVPRADLGALMHGAAEFGAGMGAGMTAPQAVKLAKDTASPRGQTMMHAGDQVVGAVTGVNPESIVPTNAAERIAGMAGAGASAFLIPGAEELAPIEAFGNAAKAAAVGTTAGAAAGVAQEAAPDSLKPVVGVATGLAAGLAAHGAGMGLSAAGRVASDAAAPFVANISEGAARGQAARVLAANTSDLGATKAALDQPGEIVPGSQPTTFQQTGDMGLGSLERGMATRGTPAVDPATGATVPEPFAARRTDQSVARTTALQGVQSGGDPNALASSLKAQFDQLDAQTQAGVDQATSNAQAATTAAGGGGNPEDYGAAVRSVVGDAQGASKSTINDLYTTAKKGDLTGNMTEVRSAAQSTLDNMRPTEKPMETDEQAIFNAAANLPTLAPAADLIALKQWTNDAASQAQRNGGGVTYGRLSQLRSAINSTLADSIAHRVATDDAMVQSGMLAPEDSLFAKLRGDVASDGTGFQVATGTGPGAGSFGVGARGSRASGGAPGAEIPPGGGLGGPPGGAGLPADEGAGVAASSPAAISTAASDVAEYRSGRTTKGALLPQIQALGGLKMQDAAGAPLQGAPEIKAILDDYRRPGLINNKSGLSPDGVREALQERGWFGANGGDSINDLHDLMARELSGKPVFHPASDQFEAQVRRGAIERDMMEAGVDPTDHRGVAAQKLAAYRDARQADGEGAMAALQARAATYGIGSSAATSHAELLADVLEHEARLGEYHPQAAQSAQAEIDSRLTAADWEKIDALSRQYPAAGPSEIGDPEGAGGYGADAGRKGAPRPPAPGSVGGGARLGAQPTYTPEDASNLKTADAAYAEHARTYNQGPVGDILASRGYAGDWKLPNGSVAAKFFHPGPRGYEDMQALYKASDPATVNPIIADYAATSLRRSAMDDKGVIDPVKFASWSKAHQDALRALPDDVQARFTDAATAGQTVADATGARVQALKDAQAGALGKVMGATTSQDVTRTIGTILRSNTAGRDMVALAASTKGDKEALAGLRQAVADHIKTELIGNTEAGTSGVSQIKADQFQTFMRKSTPALNVLFKPEEIASMDAVAADIMRSKRSETAVRIPGNSNTAKDTIAAQKGAGHGVAHGAVTGMLDLAGMVVGHHFGGEVGAAMGGFGAHVAQSLRAAGVSKIDQLVTTALLHPDVAKELLRKVPANASHGTQQALAMQLSRALWRVLPTVGAASRSASAPARRAA